jgi:hypothetical protein
MSHLSFTVILLLASINVFLLTFQISLFESYLSMLLFPQMPTCLVAPCQFRLLGKGRVKLLKAHVHTRKQVVAPCCYLIRR